MSPARLTWEGVTALCVEGRTEKAGGSRPARPQLGFNKINTCGNSVVLLFRKTPAEEMGRTTPVPMAERAFSRGRSQDPIRIIGVSHEFVPKQSHSS